MSLFSKILEPKGFDRKVDKLFDFYKSNTKYVSMRLLKNSQQLKIAVTAIANVLDDDIDSLSYEEVKNYSSIFTTVLARVAAAGSIGANGLIERTSSILFERYPVIKTEDNAQKITKKLFDLI